MAREVNMYNSTGDKISLRKATTDEVAYLKVKAAKRDNEMRKKFVPFFVFVLLIALAMIIYKHSILYICIFALGLVAFCIYLFVISNSFSRQISKGEFHVQRGTIVDKRESAYNDNELYPKVVFESDDGTRSVISVEKLDYPNFYEGPCIVIKWDYYEDTDVYEIVMLDQSAAFSG